MLTMLNFIMSITFMTLNHPMTMGLTLLIQTILISMITGLLNSNFWFSYILFLIMIGGMLVLFIYMTSIASNEMFAYSNSLMMMMSILMFSISIFFIFNDSMWLNLSLMFNESFIFKMNNFYNLTKFFTYPSIYMIFFMIIYLLLTLVVVVKITKIEYGPLRQKF
uniref:NADH-ubiquinone oxidoreductase chain 6 n=1 Tax=Staphylinidae sp. BMNH 1274669 TaxID=1796591 RepID=A0A140EG03_9COLE|nr:NADH dehydrogenase subunit 6 [Staphylinidae sp. BMNH 1274669]